MKTLDYYLERNRVAAVPSGERNFHIFITSFPVHHLRSGNIFIFWTKRHTVTLGGQRGTAVTRPNGSRDDDAPRFDQLKIALKTIGFSKRHVAQTCQLVATILHLGNLEFIIDRHRNEDAAVVHNVDVLEIVSDFFGIHPSELEAALSYKTKLVKKELCTVFLDLDGASDNRDNLANPCFSPG